MTLIIIVIIVMLVYLIISNNKEHQEHLTTTTASNNESLQNMASMLNSGNATLSNLTLTGNLTIGGMKIMWDENQNGISVVPHRGSPIVFRNDGYLLCDALSAKGVSIKNKWI